MFALSLAGLFGGGRSVDAGGESLSAEQQRISAEIAAVMAAVQLPDPFEHSDRGQMNANNGDVHLNDEHDAGIRLARIERQVGPLFCRVTSLAQPHARCHPTCVSPVMSGFAAARRKTWLLISLRFTHLVCGAGARSHTEKAG